MTTRFALLFACLAACADDSIPDLDLAAGEAMPIDDKADDASDWAVSPTLHVGARVFDGATAGGRRVHPLWIAGTAASPVALDLEVRGAAGYDVRIAVLGPLTNGTRAVLAADGYASRKHVANVHVDSQLSGEHLVVIGSFGLQH